MSRTISLPYQFAWSPSHPHIAWADLYNNGVLTEIAVMALDENNGDLHFIVIATLDDVDKRRLLKILSKREAATYPLWDVMYNSTLKNGMNALEYFNQLVKTRTKSGQIFVPQAGRIGAMGGPMSAKPSINAPAPAPQTLQDALQSSSYQQPKAAEAQEPKRGPGRPPAPKKQ